MKFKLLIILTVALLVSCKKNKKATLVLNFQTEIDGQIHDMSSLFQDADSRYMRFELLKFYIADISLTSKKGDIVQLSEIELIDLGTKGIGSISLGVPVDDYSSISFGIGVPKTLNEADPSSFTEPDHPLSTTQSTYWGMNGMYRFVMIDGRYDNEPDGTFDGTFSYHTGYNDSYRVLSFNKNLTFDKDETLEITISINLVTVMAGSGGSLDIVNENNYHGDLNNQHLSTMVSDNFSSSFTIKE